MLVPPSWHARIAAFLILFAAGLSASACVPVVVVGAGAGVASSVAQERGFTGVMADTRIRAEINHLWFQKSEILFRKTNLQVQEGRVLLTGVVPDPETRIDAVRLAWQAPGVKEVINEMEVADETTLTDIGRDNWIATKIKARLIGDAAISSLNYSIEVVNQRIYLIGIAQDQTELDRVIYHAKEIAYVRSVTNYVRLKDDPARAA